jgi:DNA primase
LPAKQKAQAFKLGLPQLDFSLLRQSKDPRDWFEYCSKLERLSNLLRDKVEQLQVENERERLSSAKLRVELQQSKQKVELKSDQLTKLEEKLKTLKPSHFDEKLLKYHTLSLQGQLQDYYTSIRSKQLPPLEPCPIQMEAGEVESATEFSDWSNYDSQRDRVKAQHR